MGRKHNNLLNSTKKYILRSNTTKYNLFIVLLFCRQVMIRRWMKKYEFVLGTNQHQIKHTTATIKKKKKIEYLKNQKKNKLRLSRIF